MTEKVNMREVVLDTLLDMEKNDKLSHIAMENTLLRYQFLPKQDRAFFTRLCEGVLEQQIYLDYILNRYSKTPMRKCKPLIRTLLRMSAYQIIFMNVPDAAACNEAVSLAKKRGFRGLSGFVNGVLRALIRSKDKLPLPDEKNISNYLSVRYSMPEWLVQFLMKQYSENEVRGMLEAFLRAKPVTIRTNLSRITPAALKERLEAEGARVAEGNYLPYAFSLTDFNYLGRLASFREGLFSVQDESSMLPVHISGMKEGDLVVDVCAAPGGKTFHALDRGARVIARDLTDNKVDLIRDNQDRLGYPALTAQVHDALILDPDLVGKADVVIADLPCSGLGIMGRKNDIKYHIKEDQLADLVSLQRKILKVVYQYVKPGGTLLYSTCTLNKDENEKQLDWIEQNLPFSRVSIEEDLPAALRGRSGKKGYLQLIPGKDACDGFFLSRLVRNPEA